MFSFVGSHESIDALPKQYTSAEPERKPRRGRRSASPALALESALRSPYNGAVIGGRHSMRRHAANAVTVLRLALTPVFVWAVGSARSVAGGWLAAGCFVVIAGSDFLDGHLARRLRSASNAGRMLDHGSDICFVSAALTTYWWLGVVPWWVPASILAAFAAYVVDSLRQRGPSAQPRLIGSRIGHAGGILNYALIGVLVGNETVGMQLVPPALLQVCFWIVPIYSGAAIVCRLPRRAERETRHGGASPADRKGDAVQKQPHARGPRGRIQT